MASKKLINAIKRELMNGIDRNSSVQQEKVERYMNLVKIFYQLDESIEEMGTMVTTKNGSQTFIKPNPAIAEKNKINASLIALGKDLGLDNHSSPATTSNHGESELI